MNPDLNRVRLYAAGLRRRTALAALARRCAALCAAALGGCAFVQVLFAVFPWVALPLLWDLLIAALAACAGASAAELLWLRQPGLGATARAAEERARLLHPWLSLSLELSAGSGAGSADLTAAVHEQAAAAIPSCPSGPDSRGLRPLAAALALSAAAFTGGILFLQPHCAAFWQLPFSYLRPAAGVVKPGTVYLPVGAPCTLRLEPVSSLFPSCRITCAELDGSHAADVLLFPGDSGRFSYSLGRVSRSVAYQFTLGNTVFPADTIVAVPAPRLSRLAIRLVPPRYTGMGPASLPDGQGNFAAYPGTRAHFSLSAPYPLAKALLVSPGRDVIPLSVVKCDAEGDMVVSSQRSYTFALSDTFNQASDSIPLFSIDVIPDAPPSVVMEKPGRNMDCTPAMAETLWAEAVDDIGISRLSVSARKAGEAAVLLGEHTFSGAESPLKLVRLELPLALNRFSLYPGDTLWYWASACDNRRFGGPQCAFSDTFFFRVPSFEEIHEKVVNEEDYTEQALAASRKRTDNLQQSVENLMQSTRGKKSLSWEQQQIIRDVKQEMSAQADSLGKAVSSFREAVDKIKQEQPVSSELLSKMDEVQKAIEELRRQYGDSLLFSLPRGNETVSLRDVRESLEKLKKELPDLAARLDNTLRFLAMLKRDQELGKLAADAMRLSREQQEVSSQEKSAGECLSKQEGVCKGVDGLLADIDKNTQNADSALFSKLKLPALDKLMPLQKSMRSCLSEKRIPPSTDMNAMAGSLSELSENLSNMQSCALAKRLEKDREVLLDITHDALGMAGMQQSIADASQAPGTTAGQTAELEQDLSSALDHSMEKMNRLAMVSPRALVPIKKAYDNAALSLRDAVQLLTDANRRAVSPGPEAELGAIAQAALDALADLGGQSQSQSGGMGGMMSGLRRLSAQQAMVNAATGDLLRSLLSSGGLGESEEENAREAGGRSEGARRANKEARAAQKAVADELKRLADRYGKEAGASLDRKARELEDEARRLSNMFDNPSQELSDRQDRFLSRMLETALSQHKQDEGKEERKSQSAKTVFSSATPGGRIDAPGSGLDAYYRLRQRAFSGNFPESYRLSVKNYFDSLGVLFLKEK